MKTIVLYQSKNGATKQYAEDIARGISCEVLPLKKFRWKRIDEYDTIVFGGWVMGGQIQGLNDFLLHWDAMSEKNVLVFSVGMSFKTPQSRQQLIDSNVLYPYHIRFYQFRGSFDYSKLGPIQKVLINTSLRAMANNPDSADDVAMLENLKTTPIQIYDEEAMNKILSVLHRLAAEPKKGEPETIENPEIVDPENRA